MRLIDADKFFRNYPELDIEPYNNAPTVCGNNPKWCENCVSKGKCASTRPHGKWIFDKENSFTIDMFRCSICGYFGATHFNFCPKCGAKMDGGEEE